jgi:hypothetical protein
MKTHGGSLNEKNSHSYISGESILVPVKRHLALFAVMFRNTGLHTVLCFLLSGFHVVISLLFSGIVFSAH